MEKSHHSANSYRRWHLVAGPLLAFRRHARGAGRCVQGLARVFSTEPRHASLRSPCILVLEYAGKMRSTSQLPTDSRLAKLAWRATDNLRAYPKPTAFSEPVEIQ